jgi:hypothetical protein
MLRHLARSGGSSDDRDEAALGGELSLRERLTAQGMDLLHGRWLRDWADAVRRNHGLEHATVSILFTRRGPSRIAGRASADGFFIVGGDIDEQLLDSCAREALSRMQRGERSLAVSPFCGTNIAVSGALTAAFTMFALARTGDRGIRDRFANASTAAMFGVILAQPVGRLVQKHLTTRGDVQYVEIIGTRTLLPGVRKVYTSGARYRTPESD